MFDFTPTSKNINDCPHCGHLSYFMSYNVVSYYVKCSNCGCSGPIIELPSYWSKGQNKLAYRIYSRAVLPWNQRFTGRMIHVDRLRKRDGF